MEKYDRIGNNYNSTRKADPYLAAQLYQLMQPQSQHHYLDIGCGTGNYTLALAQKGLQLIGIDPSEKMLTIARSKSKKITWKQGKAEAIPLQDEVVDGIFASLTLHHWFDLEKGFSELHRVLKPKGNLVIFTATPKQMQGYWLNHYFPKMLKDSIQQMPSFEAIEATSNKAGFKELETIPYFIQENLEDLFLYAGKQKPNLYLDPEVRKGISSFSDLANQTEIKTGLNALEEDIKTQKIKAIIEQYANEEGDYLFIKIKK